MLMTNVRFWYNAFLKLIFFSTFLFRIVDESGSSVYSVSDTAEEEFGKLDAKLISAG